MKLIYIYKAPGDSDDMNRVDMEMKENKELGTFKVTECSAEFENFCEKEFIYLKNEQYDPKNPNHYRSDAGGIFVKVMPEIKESSGGRRRSSKNRPTARRRSSKNRPTARRRSSKARKSRATRRR